MAPYGYAEHAQQHAHAADTRSLWITLEAWMAERPMRSWYKKNCTCRSERGCGLLMTCDKSVSISCVMMYLPMHSSYTQPALGKGRTHLSALCRRLKPSYLWLIVHGAGAGNATTATLPLKFVLHALQSVAHLLQQQQMLSDSL